MRIPCNPNLRPLARRLRKEGTLAEVLLWEQLKGRKIRGYEFTRRKPIGNHIVDFHCTRLRVAIEVGGVSHDGRPQQDKMRQKEIGKQGVRVLRFYDSDAKTNFAGNCRLDREERETRGGTPTPLWSPPKTPLEHGRPRWGGDLGSVTLTVGAPAASLEDSTGRPRLR